MARIFSQRRSARTLARGAVAAALLVALSGCGIYDSVFSSSSSGAAAADTSSNCPVPTILRPLANTAIFAAPTAAPRPEQVAFYGLLSDAGATCDTSGNNLSVKLNIVVVGQRGPAAGGGDGVDLDYFVAATGPDQSIISKNPFRVHIALPNNRLRAGVTDHIDEVIPLAGRPPGKISLIVGFQLSPTAVEFYKHFPGR